MIKIQVQSVVYCNEKKSLERAVQAMANAVRVYKEICHQKCQVTFVYGDGSPTRVMEESDVKALQEKVKPYMDFQYHLFGMNTGSAKGHNILARRAKSDYILIMNPDVKVSPHYWEAAMRPFADPKVAMVEARQTPVEHSKVYDEKTFETPWATTACAVIRRDVFEKLKGFDDKTFFLYCDDLDFSWRLRLAGCKIIYQPLAAVYHAKTLSADGHWQPTAAEMYYSAEAALMMAHKWSNPERVKMLLESFSQSGENEQKAAAEFKRRKKEGTLPEPIDPQHKVACFIGNNFSEHRFTL